MIKIRNILAIAACVIGIEASAQTRIIDIEVVREYPDSGHYFISPGLDSVEYYIVNLGPDTIYESDGYLTRIKLANVILNPKVDYVGSVILPGDSLKMKQLIDLKYYNHRPSIDLCIETYVYSSTNREIFREKDSVEMYANNQPCTKVGHNRIELGSADPLPVNDFVLFPVPANNRLKVESLYPILSLDIVNASGSSVLSYRELNKKQLDLDISMLAAGFYVVKIETYEGAIVKKVVITD